MTIRENQHNHGGSEPPEVLTTTEARQGSRTLINRNVLIGGLILVIAAFAIVYFVLYR